jgi:hypothetical protein
MAQSTRSLPVTHEQAEAILGTKNERRIANNTMLVRHGDTICIRLHATEIITFYPNGAIRLFTGGYRTATTKQRMNAVLNVYGVAVHQERSAWYLRCKGETFRFEEHTRVRTIPIVEIG